jgi:hypothetical protein
MKKFIYPVLAAALGVILWGWFGRAGSPVKSAVHSDLQPQATLQSTLAVQPETPLQEGAILARPPETTAVNAGGLSLPLVFQNPSVSSELRHTIAADLNLIFGHLSGSEFLPSPRRTVDVGGQDYAVTSVINFTGRGRYVPEAIEGLIGQVVEIGGQRSLYIDSRLETIYGQARQTHDKNRSVFEAFETFLSRLNSISDAPPEDFRRWIHVDGVPPEVLNAFSKEQFIQAFGNKRYQKPSLLEFYRPSEAKNSFKDAWTAQLYVVEPSGISDAAPTAIFLDGEWKLLLSSQYP